MVNILFSIGNLVVASIGIPGDMRCSLKEMTCLGSRGVTLWKPNYSETERGAPNRPNHHKFFFSSPLSIPLYIFVGYISFLHKPHCCELCFSQSMDIV